MIVEE